MPLKGLVAKSRGFTGAPQERAGGAGRGLRTGGLSGLGGLRVRVASFSRGEGAAVQAGWERCGLWVGWCAQKRAFQARDSRRSC